MHAFDVLMVLFRIVHILAGVIWVGSVTLLVLFIQPSAAAIGPAGAPFMAELLGKRRVTDWIIGTAVITVTAGLALYVRNWLMLGSFDAWIATPFGRFLTLGMVAALTALTVGVLGTRPSMMAFMALGREVAASGKPPSPETAALMATVQGKLRIFARTTLALLIVAVLAMAVARSF